MQPSPGSTLLAAASRSASPQWKDIFGGSIFTSPLEIGDLSTERKGGGSERGGEKGKDSSMSKNAPRTDRAGKIEAKTKGSKEGVKAETAGRTQDDIARSPVDAKSLRSLNSRKSSQRNTKQGMSRRFMVNTRGSNPEQIPVLSKEPTEDVAGPRFKSVKEPEGERCAGDYPPIYVNGFVSPIPSAHIYVL